MNSNVYISIEKNMFIAHFVNNTFYHIEQDEYLSVITFAGNMRLASFSPLNFHSFEGQITNMWELIHSGTFHILSHFLN